MVITFHIRFSNIARELKHLTVYVLFSYDHNLTVWVQKNKLCPYDLYSSPLWPLACGWLYVFFVVVFFPPRSAATTYQVWELSDAGQSRPLNRPLSEREIKAKRLPQLNHKSIAIHRKELVAQN